MQGKPRGILFAAIACLACQATPRVPERVRFVQKDLLACREAGRLPDRCQIGGATPEPTDDALVVFELLTHGCVTAELLGAIARVGSEPRGRASPAIGEPPPSPGMAEAVLFVSSRARFEVGRYDDARTGFRDLANDMEWSELARECLALIDRASSPASGDPSP